ncbi:MAG: hypothetical protein ACQCN5_03810 [Candidatus Bathyarchaeia archaeon]|jgi:hypothetical protein
MPIENIKRQRRWKGKFDWSTDEPELIVYAVNIAKLWLQREREQKGRITADHLDKACGILSEEIFAAELNELNVPHLRTVPLLNKEHPTNLGKPYDFKIGRYTVDLKSISPLPPPSGHHWNLNVNKAELGENQEKICDYYIATKCLPELPAEKRPLKNDEDLSMKFAYATLKKVEKVQFLGWATGDELCSDNNLVSGYNFYSKKPPHNPMRSLAKILNIPLESPATEPLTLNP